MALIPNPDVKCKCCDRSVETSSHMGPEGALRRALTFCFECAFWSLRLAEHTPDCLRSEDDPHRKPYVVVLGHVYWIGEEYDGDRRGKGHGGADWLIKHHSGEITLTTNLWHRGEVPPHFREYFPDNAEFLKPPSQVRREKVMGERT